MSKWRLVFLTAMGSGLEYYDFVIYALAVHYISHTFFPAGQEWLGLLNSLLIFATGYVVRPLGGLIFGSIGDRFGRKKSFTAAIFLMAIATLAIAFTPGYQHWGVASPLLLTLWRCLQGISQGAELSGAFTFIYEHVEGKRPAWTISLVNAGVGLGSLLGSLAFFVLHAFFSEQEMLAYAWRIAFFIGGIIGFCAYFLRRYASETGSFMAQEKPEALKPVQTLFRKKWRALLIGIGLTLFPASFIIYFLFLPSYLGKFYQFSPDLIYFVTSLGFLWSALLIPFFGALADKVGPKRQLFSCCVFASMVLPALFCLPMLENAFALIVFSLAYQTIIAIGCSCYGPLLAKAFPTSTRYTGVAVSYNVAFAIAGFMPLLITSVLAATNVALVASFLLSGLALISALAVGLCPE
jgi:MFS family permease